MFCQFCGSHHARGKTCEPTALSRRQVMMAGPALTAASTMPSHPRDAFVEYARSWLVIEGQRVGLLEASVSHEARLHRTFGWVGLSPAEQAAIPEGVVLREIGERLDLLSEQGDDLYSSLAKEPVRGPIAVLAAILVVEQFVQPEDSPEAHELISRAADALIRMYGVAWARPPHT